jgi:Tol biopolymer transport system component
MKSKTFVAVLALIAAMPPVQAVAATDGKAADWDVTQPRGATRSLDFNVSEGTWMSSDLSPDGRWIIFDLLGNIYRVSAKGGDAQLLTTNPGISVNYHPRYSPDGKTIVFISDRSAQDNIWLMNADGTNPRALYLDVESRFAEPAWTPDGKSIVATRRFKRPGMGFIVTTDTIWRVGLDGSAPEELVGAELKPDIAQERLETWRGSGLWAGSDRHQWPSVSPDGKFMYFQVSPYGGNPRRIQRLDLETRQVQDVTESKDRYFGDWGSQRPFPLYLTELAPEVSPDGKWLAFAGRIPEGRVKQSEHEMTGRTALWLRNLATGEDKILMDPITRDAGTNLPNYQERVLPGYSWARDSKSLVLTAGGKLKRVWLENGKVDTIPFNAHIQRTVSEMTRADVQIDSKSFAPHFVRWPTTSPNGASRVFEAVGQLWIAPVDAGAVPRPLVPVAKDEVQMTPNWSPDGSQIVYTTAVEGRAGHVWVVDGKGDTPRRVTREAGIYMRPSFSADGKQIYVDRWPSAIAFTPEKTYWELFALSAADGSARSIARDKGVTRGDATHAGTRFYTVPGDKGTTLHGLDIASGTDRAIATVAGPIEEFALSPDRNWLAVAAYQDAYLIPLGANVEEGIEVTAPNVRRVTRKGGRYIHWLDSGTLEMASGGALTTYDVAGQKLASAPSGLTLPRNTAPGTMVLRNATVLTMNKRKAVQGDVVVQDGRIRCVGTCAAPADAKIIDATGKTIMPGMMDVHAHSIHADEGADIINLRRLDSAAYLAYGITTIHDPFGSPVPQFSIADLVEAGRIVAPRSFSTGYALTCTGPTGVLHNIDNYEDALDHIDRQASYGVLSLKDYLLCDRRQRQMIVEAARTRKMTVTTELGPINYMLAQAMNGLTGWEHPLQYELYDDVVKFFGKIGSTNSSQIYLSDFSNGTALEYWVSRNSLLKDPKAARWTPWQRGVALRLFNKKPEEEYLFPVVADGLRRIKQNGGHVALGAHGEVIGLGSHWELWTMTSGKLGLSNEEALETATIDTARFIGLDKELGSIEVGKIADLLVLDGDPRADIRKTAALRYVMKAGRLYEADTLNELWPNIVPYGTPSGHREDILRQDVRVE